MRHQEVIYNLAGQSFFYDPPEGRPAASPAPTCTVYLATDSDDGGGVTESATTGSCSIDAVDTTLSAAAAAGDTEVSVASAASIARGQRYLISAGAGGDRELAEVAAISGTTISLRRPLQNAYASGADFEGTRISISVNATWVADKSNITDALGSSWRTDVEDDPAQFAGHAGYRLRWTYTVAGVATIGISFADLVRYSAKNLVTALDVDGRFPGFIDRLTPDDRRDQGAGVIANAFDAVRFDLLGDAQTMRKVRDTDIVGELTMYKAVVMAAANNVLAGRADKSAVDVAEDLYKQRYNQLAREPKFPVDTAGSGASAQPQRLPAWRR
jgi:hypothetical protein